MRPLDLDKIPPELKAWPQWVVWRREEREGKPTKIPYRPQNPKKRASSTDPDTWGTFEQALSVAKTNVFHGVGYVFSPQDDYSGVDFDHCRDPKNGQLKYCAQVLLEHLSSYDEASPSNTGIHAIIKAKVPPGGNSKGLPCGSKIEMYSQGRYFTMTGNHLESTPTTIEDRQAELTVLHAEIFGKPQALPKDPSPGPTLELSDRELIEKVQAARNGDKFSRLWQGDTTEYDGDDSRADLALCGMLAFYAGPDPGRIDRLFRQSGLFREKWNRQDYRDRTITRALEGMTEFYTPGKSQYRSQTPPADDGQDYDRLERESIQQEAQELPPDWRGPQASKPETPKPEQKTFPPLDYATITPTSEAFRNPPPPREFLFKNLLPKGIIGEIIAVGGTGKGFLMNLLGLSLATGTKIGLFEPERAFKVAYIGAEDDQPELHRRAVWTAYNIWPEGWPPSIDNFIPISVAGEIGPLMRLEGGNPVPAPGYDWLCKSLENLKDIEVLILDPKSMLYGLEENNNDHNTAWVKCLQSIANRFGITILFCHHESKARAGSKDQASSRGGGALTDGCRWVANIKTMDTATAKKFSIIDPQNFVEFVITKSNYAPRLPAPVYFCRGQWGELSFADLIAERTKAIASRLVELLDTEAEPITENELLHRIRGKAIADKIKEDVEEFNRVKDLTDAMTFAKEAGWLFSKTQRGQGHRGKTIIEV